ncbi:deoxyribodipyrimidine photo-lyase [Ramlibacter ginsenosidimutans]|uniref:Deoxyribodipyrimidine photo-lyase n=1 Tax=Ramlibacter ginsenosidimutans TaxID=502333 RepID=A0A934TQ78_9BURK|nr:deoxyribodipyrimidine photo-lyase [Ramlibacter ginsenosidimutans]MBK6005185.1 deoxyribodipyrimidine photo-lyase [Ramlibacter ginsenosidimutans]
MDTPYARALLWYRRDLRANDHAALSQALRSAAAVHCAFVFDRAILDELPRQDRRLEFIRESAAALDADLRSLGGPGCGLITLHASAAEALPALARRLGVQAVFANHDDEPAALARDQLVRERLAADGIAFHTSKDTVVFERGEVLTQAGAPYSVFTPYSRAWLAKVDEADLRPHPVREFAARLAPRPEGFATDVPALAQLGFEPTNLRSLKLPTGSAGAAELLRSFAQRMDRYEELRDLPSVKGPSYLGVHLRFGRVSIRELVRAARAHDSPGAATWLKELVWREFYFQVLANFPQVGRGESFRPAYDRIAWEQGPQAQAHFAAWCEGRTGYPLVDAAMAQINQTGYMHNRLRMVTASFLCKDLGLDWRWGERYFAEKLNDYELASNNGGWQWASSSGCDAQPYFRIFHPVTQGERFDPDGKFVLRYLPQLAGLPEKVLHAPWKARPVDLAAAGITLGKDYPLPIVDHAQAREQTLRRYSVVKERDS